ncbi:MAG: oxidoreductase domain protein [Verrucomicrobiales bacterium]|nr:oxidoreductase domain protein [Verrucomicrobiales bacterium]
MTPHFHISRRRFLKTTALVSASLGIPKWFVEEAEAARRHTNKLGPNDKPGIAWIGCGNRGRVISKDAAKHGEMRMICDVDDAHLAIGQKEHPNAKPCKDFRQILERDDIHVIVNSTPDHWHTLINIAAVNAGKDVYSEKPLTLTIDEGRHLVRAVDKTKRILQTGSQQRSDKRFRHACELVRNGRIGKLKHIMASIPTGPHQGPFATAPVPAGLDWNMWQGQTPAIDYVPERCHHSFRYWFEYSGGMMTDWGAHHNDIAQWATGSERTGPVEIDGKSLVAMIPGGYTTASQFRVEYTYANGVKLTCKDSAPDNSPNGVTFEGTDGWIFVSRKEIKASNPDLLTQPLPASAVRLYHSENHMQNFFDCVRSRKAPICEAEIGHRSVSVCHLGVLSMRLGRKLKWDPKNEKFVDDKEANKWLAREMRKPFDYSIT